MEAGLTRVLFAAAVLPGLLAGAAHHDASAAHPVVPAFERFYQQEDSNAVRGGILLLTELNCVACHSADGISGLPPAKQAPRLDEVGWRVRPAFMRALLADPQHAKPGTTMPRIDIAGTAGDRDGIEPLVHFLASRGQLMETAPLNAAVKSGERLFHTVGCVACHDVRRDNAPRWSTSAAFPDLSSKYTVPGLASFLEDPLAVRPSGRMPHLNLTREEAQHIACFLLRDVDVPTNLTYQYYEGSWQKLPEFARLQVKTAGRAGGFDVGIGAEDHFAVRFEGRFPVDRAGEYRFFLTSDDGSRLYIDGELVVDNDGVHPALEANGHRHLASGSHSVVVEYFEQAGGQALQVDYQGPGVKRRPLELAIVAGESASSASIFQIDSALAAQGKQLFQSAGCAACHEMTMDGQRIVSRLPRTKKLRDLDLLRGCLSATPVPGAPHFSLTTRQRQSLAKALRVLRGGMWELPVAERITHTMATFNCVACHERSIWGGVETFRNPFFQSDQPEMGDEGRIPPHLTGVGDKLQRAWVEQVLQRGAKDRPYMFTRMPRFGEQNVSRLAAELAVADRGTAVDDNPPDSLDRKVKSVGRQLVGDKGLSCVKCHTWGDTRSTGIQSISMTAMTRRLRHDWFHRYLLDPQRYRAGTRMPAAWPNGQSPFPKILEGDARRQIEAIWTYLLDGANANPPTGLVANPIELVADKEPIIYRNFLQGAGTRAVGVGYPERINVAFDAENCRLALAWHGAFLDASLHWIGRGSGFQGPLGDNVLEFAPNVPVASLRSLNDAWPTQPARELGVHFRGYRLDEHRRPAFFYRWQDLRFEEYYEPVVSGQATQLQRLIQLAGTPPAEAFLRVAVADRIESARPGEYLLGADLRFQLHVVGAQPLVRSSGGRQELLVPLTPELRAVRQLISW